MTWNAYYRGDGTPRDVQLADPPPWRTFPRRSAHHAFQPPEGLTDAVNAALYLRRPLLITGSAGTGKSTVIEQVAAELRLGPVLRWHITSRSTLAEALCRYDGLGHIHALRLHQMQSEAHAPAAGKPAGGPVDTARTPAGPGGRRLDATPSVEGSGDQVMNVVSTITGGFFSPVTADVTTVDAERLVRADDIAPFLRLGPLGTALLPGERPRALLIDEIDKSDLDLPSDLLDVLERGEFEIPELARHSRRSVAVRTWDALGSQEVTDGRVQCSQFPFIVMTSNGERDFAPPFLRRCIRYTMPAPTVAMLRRAVEAHLETPVEDQGPVLELIEEFASRVALGDSLAVDQLLNAVKLVTDASAPTGEQQKQLLELLLQKLNSA